ncbi:MAG TPA: hypothetical protein DCQ06_02120, partial [Myxococcales bacterium]|nr:hypothetical protein [Myxococcales bacterium]
MPDQLELTAAIWSCTIGCPQSAVRTDALVRVRSEGLSEMSTKETIRTMSVLMLLGILLVGCGRDDPSLPDPNLFGEPRASAPAPGAQPVASAQPVVPTAIQPSKPDVQDSAEDVIEAPVPTDSLLTGPCPLPGERTSTCLREPQEATDEVRLANILIGWRGSWPGSPMHRDLKSAERVALQIGHLARKAQVPFIALVRRYSDDAGDGVFVLDDQAEERFDPAFVLAGRRLAIGSVDVIKTRFGFHVLKRLHLDAKIPSQALVDLVAGGCPAMGEDTTRCGIDRPVKAGWVAPSKVTVEQVWIAYKGAQGRRRVTRSREDALALAVRIVHTARVAGGDFRVLQKRYSDDPGAG